MTKVDNKLVVLGAGWLGHELCKQALDKHWQVQGTHRVHASTNGFERQFVLQGEKLTHNVDLYNAYWVCAMTPRSRSSESNYSQTLQKALKLSEQLNAKGFILCSSTGVYDQQNAIYTESSEITCSTPRQTKLYNSEELVLEHNGKVLRLAGLVGPKREPGRFIAGKTLDTSSHQVVNMVHQQDVINAIFKVIEHWPHGQSIYNIVNPEHPTKQQYYQQKCQQHGSDMPVFKHNEPGERKIIGSAIEALGFSYQHSI
ncbi:NADP-binding protein [Pseudoalteromonas sp. MMG010]|uniref:NADP-binding protein n=1 Tax=Pseudoalteromonas sp. MMG010 TaxID=2822685 RepID=UPI001B3A4F76|nr:NADP-binding protein [Pseudoalteromonas sp. MMG010]MBQ4832609.1 NADP-binding protein [Pseudoalteromonas sp. MMG010]